MLLRMRVLLGMSTGGFKPVDKHRRVGVIPRRERVRAANICRFDGYLAVRSEGLGTQTYLSGLVGNIECTELVENSLSYIGTDRDQYHCDPGSVRVSKLQCRLRRREPLYGVL